MMCTRWTFYILLLSVLIKGSINTNELDIEEIYGDEGDSLILPCKHSFSDGSVMWRHQGRDDRQVTRTSILTNGSLSLTAISKHDDGIYTCSKDDDVIFSKVKVNVRTPPPALVNVTVHPSTILALLHWEVADTGGYPITHFTAQYRLKHTPPHQLPDPWHLVIPGIIKNTATEIDVYQLEPNSSYVFQIWANNKLGRGEIVELEAMTKHDAQEIELGKHLLEGAQTFDTRVWVAAVAIVMGTLVVLATATAYALYRECHIPQLVKTDEQETMELIPNIILNPWYNEDLQTEWPEPDENSNDRTALRLNNNTVVNPIHISSAYLP